MRRSFRRSYGRRAIRHITSSGPCPRRRKHESESTIRRRLAMTQWINAAAMDDIDDEDVMRFDHDGRTFAIYRVNDAVYASDGLCTHEHVHLSDGLVMDHVIECPKHNGRFDIRDG